MQPIPKATVSRRPVLRAVQRRAATAAFCLLVILTVAAWLRLSPIAYDRPYVYHPDEWAITKPALHIVATGDLNPHRFGYPSLLIYIEAGAAEIVHQIAGSPLTVPEAPGYGGLPANSTSDADPAQYPYYLWGRRLVAATGVLLALVVALGGRAAARSFARATPETDDEEGIHSDAGWAWLAGLVGAAFVALAVLPLDNSRYLTTDVPSALFSGGVAATTVWAVSRPPDRTSDRLFILAGFLAGLAASTKYNAAVVALVPAIGYLTRAGSLGGLLSWLPRGLRSTTPLLAALAAVAGFAVATPTIITDPGSVVAGVNEQIFHYNIEGHLGFEGNAVGYYLDYLWTTGFGPVLSTLTVAGAVWALLRHKAVDMVLVGFAAVYFVLVSLPAVRFERNLMPLVPFAALLAGRFVASVAAALARLLSRRSRPLALVGSVCLLALLALQPVAAAVDDARKSGLTDTRTVALQWIDTNLPGGVAIVRENYTPQPDARRYRVGFVGTLSLHDLAWYQARGFRYAIASDRQYFRYSAAGHEKEAAIYRQLLAQPVVLTVEASNTASGPKIVIVDLQPGS
jgi:hypothetical protein